jgi:murein L,D-transpeptidase YcbB/YkuD
MRKFSSFFSEWFFTGLLYLICLSSAGCQHPDTKQQPAVKDSIPEKDVPVRGYFSDQTNLHLDTNELNSFFKKFSKLKNYEPDLKKFYGYRNFLYAWFDDNGLNEQASNLLNLLNNLEKEGIQTIIPYKEIVDSVLNDPIQTRAPDSQTEILLSAEYFFYGDKVIKGISEQESTKLEWMLPRKKLDLPYLMDSILKENPSGLTAGNYNFHQYNLLKTYLEKYRQLDRMDDWELLKPTVKLFKKTDSSELVTKIRHRLYLLGDLSADSHSNHFDDELEKGISRFQERNGLSPDGVGGPGFFREINISPQENIRRIIVNMERTRWIPVELNHHYVIVNIPAFTLSAYDMDTLTLRMNVVVGKNLHKTVIFNGDIKYVVFSPYWNVPPSIMKNEILPAIRKNPDYLRKNKMEWAGNTIRQKPGPNNSLGLVKFLFPNSYNIYLHDSPAKSLFGAESRAFSHGCIRLAEPKKLAVYLLKGDSSWTEEKIQLAMSSGKEKYVALKNPVSVYIGYLTAWVDREGRLNFRNDIYKRDDELEKMIFQ